MNIIEMIKNNMSSGMLNQLSSLIGASPEQTKAAAGAAVPSILAGMSKLSESRDGADRLSEILNNLDPSIIGNLDGMFTGDKAEKVQQQGGGMLEKLLGGGLLAGLVSAIGKFTGSGSGVIQKLLAFLAPLIMGTISKSLGGKTSAQGLTQFFSEQKNNITNAMPAGFSLGNIPGLGSVTAAAERTVEGVKQGVSAMTWLLPVLLVGLGIALWFYLREPEPVKMPANPDLTKKLGDQVGQMTDSINNLFKTATTSLEEIKDAATAEAAIPKLKELSNNAEDMKKLFGLLPDAGKATIKTLLSTGIEKLKALVDKVLAIPGVGEKLKPVVDGLMAKLTAVTG
ncbi:MAG: DUF937 domain-containing protein [Planctomycetia bacterium]|nr:DUF937 domain-containing protein [Planctomycetia bacterium]